MSKAKVTVAVVITVIVMFLVFYGLHLGEYVDLSEMLKSIGLESLI